MDVVLLVGLIAAFAAGFACVAEHGYAERHGWNFLWRYGAGVLTWLIAAAPVFVAAVGQGLTDIPTAGLLYGMLALIIAVMGVFTLASWQPPPALPEEDELEAKINRALRK